LMLGVCWLSGGDYGDGGHSATIF